MVDKLCSSRAGRCSLAALLAGAILLRVVVGLNGYSGMGKPPKYGDFEAQRHWMEVATNLPVSQWYENTADNDLSYWGLDYPPLSGYQSWLFGIVLHRMEPAAVALDSSRGYESPSSKFWMRVTVLASDIICYFPAALACATVFGRTVQQQAVICVSMLYNPSMLLIDHGHFQYNCISLGLAAGAAAAVGSGRHVFGSVLFCLSLNHKQMSLYYAPAFFGHLLGCCFQKNGWTGKVTSPCETPSLPQLRHLLVLAAAVITTFSLLWAPYLTSRHALLSVLHRIFPTQRGLYEDYVANFWCVSSLVFKWRRVFAGPQLLRICTISTMLGFLPSVILQTMQPTRSGLLIGMTISAMSFFLLSYQVHEKSILLPLLPLTILAADYPLTANWMASVAPFSMFPLLKKDALVLAYVGIVPLCEGLTCLVQSQWTAGSALSPSTRDAWLRLGTWVSLAISASLHSVALLTEPPARYPYIFDAAMVSWAFLHCTGVLLFTYRQQWVTFVSRKRKLD